MPTADPSEARSLALLDALSDIQRAGLTRTATPMGSIAQNVAPLLRAMIEGKALEQQSALEQRQLALQELLTTAKIQQALREPEAKTFQQGALQALASGDLDRFEQIVSASQRMQKPSKETMAGTQLEGIKQTLQGQLGREPTAAEMNQAIQAQKMELFRAQGAAQAQGALEQSLQKPATIPGGGQFYDPNTLKPIKRRVTEGEYRSSPGTLVPLSTREGEFLRQLGPTFEQLNKLEAAARRLLVHKNAPLGAVRLNQMYLKALEEKGDDDIQLYKAYQALVAIPLTKAAVGTRINMQELGLITSAGPTVVDSVESAVAKVDNHRNFLINQLAALGLNPESVRALALGKTPEAASAAPRAGFAVNVPESKKAEAIKVIEKRKAQGWTEEEIGTELETIYGAAP